MISHSDNKIPYFTFNTLSGTNITHAIFGRTGGVSPYPYKSLNMSTSTGDTQKNVSSNIALAYSALNIPLTSLRTVTQIHGAHSIATHNKQFHNHIEADGLITQTPNTSLFMRFADCAPIMIYDPINHAIGLAHAGWRGTLSRIVEKTVGQLISSHETPPAKILAVLGPCIQACCYEIGKDVFEQFDKKFSQNEDFLYRDQKTKNNSSSLCTQNKDKWQLNLPRIVRRQLKDIGLPAQNIFESSHCTQCEEDLFFSFRRDKKCQSRMITIIGIQPE